MLVGVINTLFGSAIMFVFYNVFHLSYWLSSASNYFFGSILSYFLNKYYTFRYKKRDWKVVARFAANICLCYLVSYGVAKPIVSSILSGFSVAVRENGAMLCGMCNFYLGIIAVSNSVQGKALGGFTLKVINLPVAGLVNPMLYDHRAISQPSSLPPYFLSPTRGRRR